MKASLTLCFYEYPGALTELKHWEQVKFDDIFYVEVAPNQYRTYCIDSTRTKDRHGKDFEILICINMHLVTTGNDEEVIDFIENKINQFNTLNIIRNFKTPNGVLKSVEYFKTLIFGKISPEDDFESITNIVNKIKSIFKK